MSNKFTGITSAGSAIPVYDKDAHQALQNKADVSALTAYQEKGDYYSASNPSGFITGVDLTPYQEKSAMTSYQTVEGMSAYQPVGEYYSASNPSGFITSGELPTIGVQEGDTLDTDYDGLKIVKSTSNGNEHINLHKKSTDQWLIHGGLVPTSPGSNKYLITDNSGAMHWDNTSALAYDSAFEQSGGYITAYNGSAFKAGDELPESVSAATVYITATSGDINATIDNVSSNSGAWGGSALPISAGPGIKLQLVNDTLVASVTGQYNETVLWSGVWNSSADTIELSEPASAFEHVAVTNNTTYCSRYTYDGKSTCWSWFQPYCSNTGTLFYTTRFNIDADGKTVRYASCGTSRITTAGVENFVLKNMNVGELQVTKVVGINRISANV